MNFRREKTCQASESEGDEVLDESLQRSQDIGRPDKDVQHAPQETGEETGNQTAAQAVKHHNRRSHRDGKTWANIERDQG